MPRKFPALELQGRTCQRESGCVGHAAGSEGWLGHYLTWFVLGVGEFFHFTWGLERKQGPCIWGIITFFFYSKANAPYFPGVGVSIDKCIKRNDRKIVRDSLIRPKAHSHQPSYQEVVDMENKGISQKKHIVN